jgi:homoserine kinase
MSDRPFKVTVPATTANLGAGFDCLGLALTLRNEFILRPAERFSISIEGEGKGSLIADENNLFAKTFLGLFQTLGEVPPPVAIECLNRVPLARGLGSSASVRIGALVAANHLSHNPLPREELLQIAAIEEGHPDNVAPALLGGLVVSGKDRDKTVSQRIEPVGKLLAVLLVPDRTLETKVAREVLPKQVTLADAVTNLQNSSLTVVAFLTGNYNLLRASLVDCLHQPFRKALMPGFDETLEAARKAGAHGSALSGAGPTLVAFTEKDEEEIAEAMEEAFTRAGGGGCRTLSLAVDMKGACIETGS